MDDNIASLRALEDFLPAAEQGEVPIVLQYNKRDVADAVPVDELRAELRRILQ